MTEIKDYIRTIPDVPQQGVMFRDVTPLLSDPTGLRLTIDQMVQCYAGRSIDKVIGIDARGFLLAGAVAYQLSVGCVPIRKAGKLPGRTLQQHYELEYGSSTVEIHQDAFDAGETIVLIDDLLATGGTMAASIALIERLGGEIAGCCVVVDLPDLGGTQRIENMGLTLNALCTFRGDEQ